jgi:hypothetical protein
VVSSSTEAPRRSSSALVATVVPRRASPTPPAARSRSQRAVGTFSSSQRPSAKTRSTSVKVPPWSIHTARGDGVAAGVRTGDHSAGEY